MRIRRKKHLDERISNLSQNLLLSDFDVLNVNEAVKKQDYIDFNKVFNNDNPTYLEIGCGKGGFILEMAKLNPKINFIAVELLSNVIIMGAEKARDLGLKNLVFFNCGADYLPRYVKPNSISRIYLNFSPPYPGDRYENRRLTKDQLILNYKQFLTANGEVYQKTDDKDFFKYSFNQFEKFSFNVIDIGREIELGNVLNVETEYEKKFKAMNMPIYYLVAKK